MHERLNNKTIRNQGKLRRRRKRASIKKENRQQGGNRKKGKRRVLQQVQRERKHKKKKLTDRKHCGNGQKTRMEKSNNAVGDWP